MMYHVQVFIVGALVLGAVAGVIVGFAWLTSTYPWLVTGVLLIFFGVMWSYVIGKAIVDDTNQRADRERMK